MTVIMPYGRTLSKQLPMRSTILTRLHSTSTISRVVLSQTRYSSFQRGSTGVKSPHLTLRALRSYATAATKPASKPKAHTGRTTPKRATKKTTTKSKAKPKAKKAPKKAKAKAKAKPKPKPKKVKKAPSAAALLRQAREQRTALRERAALHTEPKTLPGQPWPLFISQNSTKGQTAITGVTAARAKYERLTPEEREALNHTANQNKAKNDAAYKQWIASKTPAQVRDINIARSALLRQAKANKVKRLTPYRPLKDDRLPKKNSSAYNFFFSERFASGDFKGMLVKEATALIGREWKALSAAEHKPFNDRAEADRVRYETEHKSVFGVETDRQRQQAAVPRTRAS